MSQRLTEVQIRNYRSFENICVKLEPFTVFVGANGAGKSNFIDALAFVEDCLSENVEMAFRKRGGITEVRRYRGKGFPPKQIEFNLHLALADLAEANYRFGIGAESPGKFRIAYESCVLRYPLKATHQEYSYEVRAGKFIKEIPGIRPKISPDRLALCAAA